MPPRALHDAGGQRVPFRTDGGSGRVDWNALERTVTLQGFRTDPELSYPRVVRVDFRPTAAAGLDPGRLAVAGRAGERVRLELWRVENSRSPDGEPSYAVQARDVVWEIVDADSIGLLAWNPRPPEGAVLSLRAVWHQRRELSRFDVHSTGPARPVLEAALRGPTPTDVLQVAELAAPLGRCFLAEHRQRGLVWMLRTPCRCTVCCVCDPAESITLALIDADRDGRLDRAVRLEGKT
jgi:hypothetical protein